MKTYEQRIHDNNKGDVYTYDEVCRLKNLKFNSPQPTLPETDQFDRQKNYRFDNVDNILSIVQQTGGEINEINTTIEGVNTQLNQYNRFDDWGFSYDQNGNTTQKGTQHFTYNYRNQLVQSQDLTSMVSFKYDALGRRIEKTRNGGAARYFYSGIQEIEECDGTDTILKQYIYGNGIDELLRVDRNENGVMVPYYIHQDGIGSTTIERLLKKVYSYNRADNIIELN